MSPQTTSKSTRTRRRVRRSWATVTDGLRAQLWPLPVLAIIIAVAAGELLPRADARIDGSLPGWLSDVLFGGDADAGRTVLDAVSSSLITVTSLTFSLTVVTLQLASSQFSPRLLRTFTRDVFVQLTLAVFLATFTYSLTVLRSVRSPGDGQRPFVPRVSVTLSFVLAVVSVLGLVLFLAHLAQQIRVETMLRNVHRDATDTLQASVPERDRGGEPDNEGTPWRFVPPADATVILAGESGFLLRVEQDPLLAAVTDADACVVLRSRPGDSLVAGTPIALAWHRDTGSLSPAAAERIQAAISQALPVGFERTAAQDIGYGLRQLTDVVNKALSPGINDPTTAVHALGHISAILCELTARTLTATVLTDDDGQPRVLLPCPSFAELVDAAIGQPRRYGASDPQVMTRLYELLAQVGWQAHPDQHEVITDQLARLNATADQQDFDPTERAQLTLQAQRVHQALRHHFDIGRDTP